MPPDPIAVANPVTMFRLASQTSLPSAHARVTAYGGTQRADTVLPGIPVLRIRAPLRSHAASAALPTQ